jgi:2-(1,2-epoxy-1,2-dihydrophenyl)acetyl-CoA isomerase
MSQDEILVERDGAIGWIRINRPERLNSLAGTMRTDIDDGLSRLEEDSDVRCVVITGVGRAFSTGGDITVMSELLTSNDEAAFEALVRSGARVVQRIDTMSKPVIAAVNGPAAGAGACLALACDLRIASETATIGMTFLRVGLHPDWGGSFHLPRLVGPALAAELVFTGGMIGAARAERLGLFNRVVPPSELEPTTRGIAGQIAAGPSVAIALAKRSLRQSLSMTLPDMLELEVQSQLASFRSPDFAEGINSFLAKRSPRFGRKSQGASAPRDIENA